MNIAVTATQDRGRSMHTASGHRYFPIDPRPSEVHIETIAHHLANRCRYNGATQHPTLPSRIFYGVAEHSVYVSEYVPPIEVLRRIGYTLYEWNRTALERLLHDGSESYNGDLIRPLKYDPLFAAPFKLVEERNERAIAARYGLRYPFPSAVKIADEAVTAAEVNQIIVKLPGDDWETGKMHDDSNVADIEIAMWSPFDAKVLFMNRFHELWDVNANCRR